MTGDSDSIYDPRSEDNPCPVCGSTYEMHLKILCDRNKLEHEAKIASSKALGRIATAIENAVSVAERERDEWREGAEPTEPTSDPALPIVRRLYKIFRSEFSKFVNAAHFHYKHDEDLAKEGITYLDEVGEEGCPLCKEELAVVITRLIGRDDVRWP